MYPPSQFQLRDPDVVCKDCKHPLRYVFDLGDEIVLGYKIKKPGRLKCSSCKKVFEVSEYYQDLEQVLAWRIKAYGRTFSSRKNEETEI